MTPEAALAGLEALAEPGRAETMAAYHKAERRYLGVPNPGIAERVAAWRAALTVPERVALADGLWKTDVFEARVAAAKLLTQARLRPDEDAWRLIAGWVPEFDSWAIADHAASAAQRRLVAVPERLDEVAAWTRSEHLWTRRAALVSTLPWAKLNHPSAAQLAERERVLGWAEAYVADREWFIQKAVAWWIRDLSKHDAGRARAFLEGPGADLAGFAKREAGKYLAAQPPA